MLSLTRKFGPAAVLALVIVAYAICFALVKAGLFYAPPILFAGLRALVGGLAILAILPLFGLSWWPGRKLWPWIIVISLSATTVNYAAMFLSPEETSVGIASVLGNIQPLFVMPMALFFLGERFSRVNLLTLTLGIAGVVLIALPSFAASGVFGLLGPALAAAASGGAALGVILIKRMAQPLAVLPVAAWQLISGGTPLVAYSSAVENWPTLEQITNLKFLSVFLLLALFGTAFATIAWYKLIQKRDVGKLSLYLFLVPVLGLIIAWLALGETFGKLEMLGTIIIIAALFILPISERQTALSAGKI